jgi:hypothetical protein
VTFPLQLNETTYFKSDTETLFEIAHTQKPEFEQRLTAVYGFLLLPKTNLELGTQYRLANYTQELEHELFMVMSLEVFL